MKGEVLVLKDGGTELILASGGVWLPETQQRLSGQEEKVRLFLLFPLALPLWLCPSHTDEFSLGLETLLLPLAQ